MIASAVRGLLAVLLVAIASTGPANAEISHIGPVVNPANGHAYFVIDAQTSWTAAEAWAVSLGGHLVTVNDAAENAWMQSSLGLASGYYWLGAYDDANTTDNVFTWVTGVPFTYQNFLPGEPDDEVGVGGQGDYLALSATPTNWGWLDTNGTFVGFVTGAIAEVPGPTGVHTPAPVAGFLFEARPTVTNDFTRLDFKIPDAASVRCRVFDVHGRCVRNVAEGMFAAGQNELTWDTRDNGGHRVPSGVYLVQLQVSGSSSARKVIVAR